MTKNNSTIRVLSFFQYTKLLLIVSLVVFSPISLLNASFTITPAFKHGAVLSQALIYDDNGNLIFVVYGEDGKIINEIGPATGSLEDAVAASALGYNAIVQAYQTYLTQEQEGAARGATILTRDSYIQASFSTLDGLPVNKPQLQDGTKSVLVRGQETLLIPEINPVLFEAPIGLNSAEMLESDIVSIILDEHGVVVERSRNNIGFKVGFYEGEEDSRRTSSSEIYGPVTGVVVESSMPSVGGIGVTGEDGKYSVFYFLPPCPGFSFEYNANLYAKLSYKNFNPKGQSRGSYYLWSPASDYCNGIGDFLAFSNSLSGQMTYLAIQGINLAMATPFYNNDFHVDTMLLTGKGKLQNGDDDIVLGATEYTYESAEKKLLAQTDYDFDKDGNPDTSILGVEVELDLVVDEPEVRDQDGNIVTPAVGGDGTGDLDLDALGNTIKYFQRQEDNATVQGVYLSSLTTLIPATGEEPTKENQPDFTRLADLEADFEHQGLLSSISEEDLKDTDLYVFRVSNGDLITERIGLKAEETVFLNKGGNDEDKIYYQVLMRGPKSLRPFGGSDFEQWQSKTQINPKLHQKKADHLRAGEQVTIVVINRATGYIGTKTTELKQTGVGGDISFPIEDIVMRAPNLKIRARRAYDIEAGLTKGEDKEYLIGFEGAGLKSDRYIAIDTEWFDHDGSPLPEELNDYGYTGRLAKVVGANVLGAAGAGLAHFKIKPGHSLQLVKLNEDVLNTEHYYVQVHGSPINRSPDFSTLGAGSDILQHRPKQYVPILVPLYDEATSLKLEAAHIKNELTLPEVERGVEPFPEPYYQWSYRPEMQFTVYDLAFDELNRVIGEDNIINVEELVIPSIDSTDQLVQFLFEFAQSMLQPLGFFDFGQELVLALGEQEVLITLDSNGQAVFGNIEHLSELEPEDFLSLQLYSNHDAGNILWEYAFLLDVEFINEIGEKIDKEHEFSDPKPVVILDDVSLSDISVSGSMASLNIKGKIYCDLADIIEDSAADITEIHALIENVDRKGYQVVKIPVSNLSQVNLEDYVPFNIDDSDNLPNTIQDMKHPYVGSFEHTLNFEIQAGSLNILLEAQNIIGNTGYDSIDLKFSKLQTNPQLLGVTNNPNTNRGLFNPVWVLISDENLSEEQITNAKVEFFDHEFLLIKKIDEQGKYFVDRPFLRIASDFIDVVDAPNITNVLAEEEAFAKYQAIDTERPEVKEELSWSYVANKPVFPDLNRTDNISTSERRPKHYKFAINTTVAIDWWNNYLLSLGYEVTSVKLEEKVSFWGQYEEDMDSVVSSNFIPITDPDTGRKGTRFVLKLAKDTGENKHNKHKRLKVSYKKISNDKVYSAHPTGGSFDIVPLKTIILAVDGLAFEAAKEVINSGETGAFKKIFTNGVNLDKPALSALPTITWANWPGVFSGMPPKDTGWMGNSFFPRDVTSNTFLGSEKYPVFSGGGGFLESTQQGSVVALGAMNTGALSSAGSIYDEIARALNKTSSDKLNAVSVNAFYTKHSSGKVAMKDSYYGADEYIGVGHNPEGAEILDDSFDVDWWTIGGIAGSGGVLIGGAIDALLDAEGSSYSAVSAWNANPELDVMSVYLPGTDNVGHGRGNHVDMDNIGETTSPVSALSWHAKTVTDRAVGRILRKIEDDGYENAVLFALTADHGQKQYRVEKDTAADADGDQFYQTLVHKGETFLPAVEEVGFNILTEEMAKLFEEPPTFGGLYGGLGLDAWFGTSPNHEQQYKDHEVVYSPDGGVAHIYLRDRDAFWQDPPPNELIKKVANLLYRESTSIDNYKHEQFNCDLMKRPVKDKTSSCFKPPFNDLTIKTSGAYGDPAAIFVKINATNNFESDFEWVKAIPVMTDPQTSEVTINKNELITADISSFIAEREIKDPDFKWPAFKARLTEMNDKNPNGSRTGDIFVIMNINEGYLTVNDDAEIFPGWHGGPTKAESFVPLMFGMPGRSFVNDSGVDIPIPDQLTRGYNNALNAIVDRNTEHSNDNANDKYLRNWHLTPMLVNILQAFEEQQQEQQ